jgi:hypothetical protein
MPTVVRNVSDLSPEDRSMLERLVGQTLDDDASIEIAIRLKPSAVAIPAVLPEWCNVYEGLTEAEIDALACAICRS